MRARWRARSSHLPCRSTPVTCRADECVRGGVERLERADRADPTGRDRAAGRRPARNRARPVHLGQLWHRPIVPPQGRASAVRASRYGAGRPGATRLTAMLLRMSTLFVRTLREDPADAEVPSHRLLVRAGYIRRAAPGIYTWLPLGLQVLAKVERVVREEMDAIGAQEVHFPALLPREPYERTGRWTEYGPNLFRLKDRRGNDYLLAPTHEEMFTLLVKDLYSSYKDLPLALYQIQTKYRDEARPRAGLLRGREFIMKDAYTFDVDDAGLDAAYLRQREAYQRIFERLGLDVRHRRGDVGRDGRLAQRGVPVAHADRRGHVRALAGRLRGQRRGRHHPGAGARSASTTRPAAHVEDTPDTPTIDTLVALANAQFAAPGPAWTAADTLKNVVVALTHPGRAPRAGRHRPAGRPRGRHDAARGRAGARRGRARRRGRLRRAPRAGQGLHRPGRPRRANTGREDAIRYLLDPRVVPGHALDHRRQRAGPPRVRPGRRARLRRRRHGRGRRGARRRPGARRLRPARARARHRDRPHLRSGPQVRRRRSA